MGHSSSAVQYRLPGISKPLCKSHQSGTKKPTGQNPPPGGSVSGSSAMIRPEARSRTAVFLLLPGVKKEFRVPLLERFNRTGKAVFALCLQNFPISVFVG